jgi:hypothetical protein
MERQRKKNRKKEKNLHTSLCTSIEESTDLFEKKEKKVREKICCQLLSIINKLIFNYCLLNDNSNDIKDEGKK